MRSRGNPIKHYIVQAGHFKPGKPREVEWGYSERRSFGEGRFRTTVRWQEGWTARVVADGYLPQPIIHQAPPANQDRLEVTVKLRPGRWVQGRVLNHDGSPAVGASVFAVGKRGLNVDAGLAMRTMSQQEDKAALRATTDEQGKFELAVGEAISLAVSSPELAAWPMALPEEGHKAEVTLPEPARLVVYYNIDDASETHEVFWQMLNHRVPKFKGLRFEKTLEVARDEPLVIKGVTPGKFQIARYRMIRLKDMGFGRMLDRQVFRIKPGETKVIRFSRDEGTRIQGTLTGLADTKLEEALIYVEQKNPTPDEDVGDIPVIVDALKTDAQGAFKTEPLPAGKYTLRAEGYPPLTDEQRFRTGIVQATYVATQEVVVNEDGTVTEVSLRFEAK